MGSSTVGPVDSFAGHSLYPKPDAPPAYPWGVPIAEPPPVLVSYADHLRRQSYGLAWIGDGLYCLRRDDAGVWLHAALTGNGWILANGCVMTQPDMFIALASEWAFKNALHRREWIDGCCASMIRMHYQEPSDREATHG